jgi:hypothetical protein
MAYRGRYGRRRTTPRFSYARKGRRSGRFSGRRSSYGRRGSRSYRRGRRGYSRRPKMYKMISPYTHKKDSIRPAHQTNSNTWTNISVGGSTPNTFILYCPTARQRNGPVGAGFFPQLDYGRSAKEIYFKGYKERMSVFATSSFVWRRIVFWSTNRVANAMGPKKGGGDASVTSFYTRQMTPTENTVDFRDFIFQGTDGTDYTTNTLHHAPEKPSGPDHSESKYRRGGPTPLIPRLLCVRLLASHSSK